MSRYHLTLAAALLSLGAAAKTITPQEALDRAMGDVSLMSADHRTLVMTVTDAETSTPACYVFADQERPGFMILSADDVALPVLAYSSSDNFSVTDMPENLRQWLDGYAAEIAAASLNAPVMSFPKLSAARKEKAPIQPLVTTKWDQGKPFNNKCPQISGTSCVTGCTATAMAQVVNYHKCPATHGYGSHSYTWKYTQNGVSKSETLTFDYASTTFDWASMLDTYRNNASGATADAVATLMLACGVGADMQYSTGASGAQLTNARRCLVENMGFSASCHILDRQLYGLLEWEDMVYADLQAGNPLIYTGYNQTYAGGYLYGHAFVCDGYDRDGFFHINWGWSGTSDGYFRLSALDPDEQGIGGSAAGYNFGQSVLFGLRPAVAGETPQPYYGMYSNTDFKFGVAEAQLGSSISFIYTAYSNSTAAMPCTIGLQLTDAAGNVTYLASNISLSSLSPNYGLRDQSISVPLPATLAAGTYTVRPAFMTGSTWYNIATPIGLSSYATFKVEGSSVKIFNQTIEVPESSDPELSYYIFPGYETSVKFAITNPNDDEYYGESVVLLLKEGANGSLSVGGMSISQTIDVLPGETVDYVVSSQIKGVQNGLLTNLLPGDYYMVVAVVADNKYKVISGVVPVTVRSLPYDVNPFDVSASASSFTATVTDGVGRVNLKGQITATEGAGTVYTALQIYQGNKFVTDAYDFSEQLVVTGYPRDFDFSLDVEDVDTSKTYTYYFYVYLNNQWKALADASFKFSTQSGIADAVIDAPEAVTTVIYDLTGRRVDAPSLAPGHYIEVTTRTDGTTATRHRLVK